MSSSDPLLEALRRALDADPENGELWLHYAGLLEARERPGEVRFALLRAAEIPTVAATALRRLEALPGEAPPPEPGPPAGPVRAAHGPGEGEPVAGAGAAVPESGDEWAAQFDWGELHVRLDDVAGLEDVKRQLQLRILAPLRTPEIFDAFGRGAGGGILLYGPPGCGKTFVARATAGELGARFASVSLHEVLNAYWGESAERIHRLFEEARRKQPTVLFFDEFDALGGARGTGRGADTFWTTVVNQILQEMDGVSGSRTGVLAFAATNMPWNVDGAFRRPGRFDRVLFVPPPDRDARRAILERSLGRLPGGRGLALDRVVDATALYTGADLTALAERAGEKALERSLAGGRVHAVQPADLEAALGESASTALEWLATARNYARYSNEGGQYDELGAFLKRVKRW